MTYGGYGNRIYKKQPLSWFKKVIIAGGAVGMVWIGYSFISGNPPGGDEGLNHIKTEKKPETKTGELPKKLTGKDDSKAKKIIESFAGKTPDEYVPTSGANSFKEEMAEIKELLKSSDYHKVQPLIDNIAKSDPRLAADLFQYAGAFCYSCMDFDYAKFFFTKALSLFPDDFDARKYLAFALYRMNELLLSKVEIERALEMSPHDRELLALKYTLEREEAVMAGYSEASRQQFVIKFSQKEHVQLKELVLGILRNACNDVGSSLGSIPVETFNVILYNEADFFDITRAPGWAGGLYDGNIRIPVRGVEGQEDLLRRVLYHEFVHAMINTISKRCPLWLNEGLAEYFSEDPELLQLGAEFLGNIQKGIFERGILRYLENGFPSDGNSAMAAYLISYLAVSKLADQYSVFALRQFMEEMGRGTNIDTAFSMTFKESYQEFQLGLKQQ